ncbi:DgyrCDS12810 [Dimorphilus gyrociliatus]|uniref:DgyrCDS12810 n=1 Tax=Dimorphilus gyrociliatus TaxID=2664684 RepID=A0A7I8W8T6_9ANNE|nr:DgyrCDS12810 [Dimorphilus gyrociliatus]
MLCSTNKKVMVPGRPENVRVTKVEGNKVTLGWKAPQYNGTSIEHYEIQYVNESDPDGRLYSLKAEDLEIEINDLEYDTQYTFKVRANTSLGWGQFSTKVSVRTVQKAEGPLNGADGSVSNGETGIIAGSAVAVLLLLVMLAVMIAIFLRR